MNRFIMVAAAVLGACSTVEVIEDQKDSPTVAIEPIQSPAGSKQDKPTSVVPGDLVLKPTTSLSATCNGTPGQWAGCRGNGCAVCSELLTSAPCYLFNHPSCSRNDTCAGQHFTCNAACPAPSGADLTCSTCNGTPGQWAGCRGNGCAVCSDLVGTAPCYFRNHPKCTPNDTCAGQYFTCNAACPAPTPEDIKCI